MPTFTFQPLLENAIIHGISPKVEGGSITVTIREDGGSLVMEVADTGTGMDEDKLSEIRKHLESGDAKGSENVVGIGLGNINRRIKAMYEDGSLEIDSKKDVGTTVTISIPLQGVE